MGPADKIPPFPEAEVFNAPATHRHIVKIKTRGNFAQMQEGDVDSSHVSFLHSSIDNSLLPSDRVNANTFVDKSPRWFTLDTDYGIMLSAQRTVDAETFQWRVNQWLMPFCTLIAGGAGVPMLAQLRCPIDDEHSFPLPRDRAHPTGRSPTRRTHRVRFGRQVRAGNDPRHRS